MTALALGWFDDEDPRELRRWAIAAIIVLGVHVGAIASYLYVHEPEQIGDDSSVVAVELSPMDSDVEQPEIAPVPETQQKQVEATPPDESQTIVAPPQEQPVEKNEEQRPPTPAMPARIKGGAVAFSLVRDDGERVEGSLGVYRDGDRFKAIVTCPPGGGVGFDVVVREGARESFPLPPAVDLTCGNEVPLPGAFQLTGSADETVCLVWNETGVVDRSANAQVGDRPSLCKRLSAAPHQ